MKNKDIKIGTKIGYYDAKKGRYRWAICEGVEDGKAYMYNTIRISKNSVVDNRYVENTDMLIKFSAHINPNVLPENKNYPVYSIIIKN